MKRVLTLIFVLALTATSIAQKQKPAPLNLPSVPQSPEMKKLVDSLAGIWKVTTILEKNEWFPEAGTYHGRSVIEAGPAGNSLREMHRSRTFAGFGLKWYDTAAKTYMATWCDTMDPNGCSTLGDGKWDGDKLTFEGSFNMPQGKMTMRETFFDITPNSYSFTVEASFGGSPMKKMMTMKYERASAAAAAKSPAQGQ